MKLLSDEARDVVREDHEDWEKVESEIVESSRWSIIYSGVFKHIPTGKYYAASWSVGATEQQDEQPFEYEDEVEFYEVVQKPVTVMQWVSV